MAFKKGPWGKNQIEVPVPIADGGTGQVTVQAAIDALSQVTAAANEYVLTKDTTTGCAIFKVATGTGGSGGAVLLASVYDKDAIGGVLLCAQYDVGA